MGDQKQASAKAMAIDTALVRELAELLGETGLTEIEVEDGERKIRVARGGDSATGGEAVYGGHVREPLHQSRTA